MHIYLDVFITWVSWVAMTRGVLIFIQLGYFSRLETNNSEQQQVVVNELIG